MPLKFIHAAVNVRISFSFTGEYYSIDKYTTLSFSIHQYMDIYIVSMSDIVNIVAVNMEVQISFQDSDFIFFVYIHRSGIAGSYSSSAFHF